jgi:hypothetical protein
VAFVTDSALAGIESLLVGPGANDENFIAVAHRAFHERWRSPAKLEMGLVENGVDRVCAKASG